MCIRIKLCCFKKKSIMINDVITTDVSDLIDVIMRIGLTYCLL